MFSAGDGHPASGEHKGRQSVRDPVGDAHADGDPSAGEGVDLDAEEWLSDLVLLERDKLVEFARDRIVEDIGEFGLRGHSSLGVGDPGVVAVDESIVYIPSGQRIVKG